MLLKTIDGNRGSLKNLSGHKSLFYQYSSVECFSKLWHSWWMTAWQGQTVELKVRMCCPGCERVVSNAIYKLKGVDSVQVELEMEKVTVVGYVDRNKVLKAVRRAGKRAEFWPTNPPLYFTTSHNYFKDMTNDYKESYNYWRHGYNDVHGDKHGSIPVTQRGDDKVSNMFNDDNVNATCSIM